MSSWDLGSVAALNLGDLSKPPAQQGWRALAEMAVPLMAPGLEAHLGALLFWGYGQRPGKGPPVPPR